MTCFDFENRLHDQCDRRQRVLSDELSNHVANCSACREMWESFERIQNAVEIWKTELPNVDRANAVLLRLSSVCDLQATVITAPATQLELVEGRDQLSWRAPRTGWIALLASAMALIIAVGIGWRASSNILFAKRQNSSPTLIASNSVTQLETTNDLNPVNDRQLSFLLHDARDAYAALASQAWIQASAVDALFPPIDTPNPFNGNDSTDSVSESLSRPLAPLSQELREAVDSLFQQVF